jgi:threonine dehydratase
VSVFAVEPEGAAETVASLKRGEIVETHEPDTIADGLRAIVGVRNFCVIREQVRQVLIVSDDEIRRAMYLFWNRMKLTIEPSAATVIAAIKRHPEIFRDRKVGAVISGGNISPADWSALATPP